MAKTVIASPPSAAQAIVILEAFAPDGSGWLPYVLAVQHLNSLLGVAKAFSGPVLRPAGLLTQTDVPGCRWAITTVAVCSVLTIGIVITARMQMFASMVVYCVCAGV